MSELPKGWVGTTIADIADIKLGKMLDNEKNKGQPHRYLRNVNVRWNSFDLEDISEMRFTDDELESFDIRDGDLLVCEGGEPGRCAVWQDGPTDLKFQKALMRLRPRGGVDPFLLAQSIRLLARTEQLQRNFTGTTIKHLPQSALAAISVPLPPLAEQKRIVAKLNALNAKSARARTELARVETLVARYKQAVLSKAFSEELTKEWPALSLDQASKLVFDGPFGSNLKSADYTLEGPRVVRLENIGARVFIEDKRTHISEEKFKSLARHLLQANDVLFSSFVSEEIRACLFPTDVDFEAINKADCFCIRLDTTKIDPQFALFQLTSDSTYRHFVQRVHGATRPRINLSQLKQYQVVAPPLEEQHEIVRRIESVFAKIDRLAVEAKRALVLVGKLDEAILAKAFRGELVPQHEDDESAERLLASIVQDRAKVPRGIVKRRMRAPWELSPPHSELSSTAETAKGGPVAKSRLDEDVFEKPYLASLIKRDQISDVQALFTTSELPVADFYKQLAWEISTKHISDSADRLKAL